MELCSFLSSVCHQIYRKFDLIHCRRRSRETRSWHRETKTKNLESFKNYMCLAEQAPTVLAHLLQCAACTQGAQWWLWRGTEEANNPPSTTAPPPRGQQGQAIGAWGRPGGWQLVWDTKGCQVKKEKWWAGRDSTLCSAKITWCEASQCC